MKISQIIFLISIIIGITLSQKVINIWNDDIPYDNGDTAEMTIFLPDSKKATGRAIVICPGGGYVGLAIDHEGFDWAPFFNQQGIAVFVLKYRMPKGNYHVPISDAEEAIKIVRNNAKEWNIDPNQIGIMGFSAGGHLASTIATHSKYEAKPDFQILFYPVITMDPSFTHLGSMTNLIGEKPSKELIEQFSNELQINNETPRAFITLSDDDTLVVPKNSIKYYLACNLHGVPATIHIYPSCGHGWGFRDSFDYHLEMLKELKTWLNSF